MSNDLSIIGSLLIAIIFAILWLRKPTPIVSSPVSDELNEAIQQLGQLKMQLNSALHEKSQLELGLNAARETNEKLLHQKKSSEVRTGHITEQVAVLLPEFPCPLNTVKFFGSPIDFISIDLDAELITFIEIKTGGSILSEKQRKIRKLVQEKKIAFAEVRVDEKGVKVK